MPRKQKKTRNLARALFPLFLFLIAIGLFLMVYWLILPDTKDTIFTTGAFQNNSVVDEKGLVITKDNALIVGAVFLFTGVGSASLVLNMDAKKTIEFS